MSDADADVTQDSGMERIGQYVQPHQMERLRDLGYIGDAAWEKYKKVGIVTVENADGRAVILCPDMWEAPDTIGPIISTLGKRNVRLIDTGTERGGSDAE